MFAVDGNDIRIMRGDTGVFTLNLEQDGQPYDYSGDAVVLTVRRSVHDPEVLIRKDILYGENVAIAPEDTADLPCGTYWYDVQLTTQAGVVDTVIPPSRFVVLMDVTRGGDGDG